ncbi:hypothetical protein HYW76_00610 [Candidatus Pacearchaeota archaeon]|nr:hypothetical protein [Candidatus Pacearchaeota archaeon]
MRTFIYFSSSARTSGNWDDLMKAGRMDIVCNVIIHSFSLSHQKREDVELHLVFYGMPDPPKHIVISTKEYLSGRSQDDKEKLTISKKDIAGFIKKMLYKYREGEKTEVFAGCFIEKKNLYAVLDELKEQGKKIFLLDGDGQDIREVSNEDIKNGAFLLGDHDGLPRKEIKRLKQECEVVSVGNKTYFASQVVTIVNNEIDRRES